MANHLAIEEIRRGLLIRVTQSGTTLNSALSGLVATVVILFFGSRFFSWPITIALAILVAAGDWFSVVRGRVGELKVTDSEFTSHAHIEGWFLTKRSIPAPDIRWLEYQEDTTGPETAHHPGGLYAVVKGSSVCILPRVDESQTTEIIERIWQRFPDFRKQCADESDFGRHYTLLNLDNEPPIPS